jgi:precorrin-6B methylase 2
MACEFLQNQSDVTILGVGCAPELQALETQPEALPRRIIACDMDPAVAEWAKAYAETPNMRGGLDFRHENLVETLKSLPSNSQDAIWIGGVAAYVGDKLPAMMTLIWSRLKKGGRVLLDLQVLDDSLLRNMEALNWSMPSFTPIWCVEEAVATMEHATAVLSYTLKTFYTDPRLESAIGVMFSVTKGRMTIKTLRALLRLLRQK